MKNLLKIFALMMLLSVSSVQADSVVDAADLGDADNHFSVINTAACPETVQQSLFEQQAWAAVIIPRDLKEGLYQLKLQGVRGHLLYFSEQPFRMGRINNIRFYKLWLKSAKDNDKLNVKAYMEGTTEKTQNYIFQLSNPIYKATTVSFDAKLVSQAEINARTHFTDVTLIIQVPECASCAEFPCLSC